MSIDNLHVLIVAEHASLKFGGEAALPLHYFRVLRQRGIETWLVVHERTRDELKSLFEEDLNRIYFVPDTFLHRIISQLGELLPRRLAYVTFGLVLRLITQILQRRIIKQVAQKQHIDIIHQPIPVSPKEPSMIFGMGVPVIIGPMNGGMDYPPAFRYMNSKFVSVNVRIGRLFANLFNQLIPGKLKATTLLVANQRTREALPKGICGKVIELVENGVDLSMWQLKPQSQTSGFKNLVQIGRYNPKVVSGESGEHRSRGESMYPSALSNSALAENFNNTVLIEEIKTQQSPKESQQWIKFVFVGRLVGWKAVDLLLLAFKQVVEQVPVELEIIGKGPEQEVFEAQAKELGLTKFHNQDSRGAIEEPEVVHFTGWLSQAECAERLRLADVMVLPSLFECGGAVVLEAMAMGVPVIATNWGGPADYLDESCGILVEPASRNAFIDDLAAAMLKMAKSPELRKAMGQAAHQRVLDHFDWEVKVDKMIEIYQETIKC